MLLNNYGTVKTEAKIQELLSQGEANSHHTAYSRVIKPTTGQVLDANYCLFLSAGKSVFFSKNFSSGME